MHFDATITISAILGGIAAIIGMYVVIINRLTVLETMVRPMWQDWIDRNGRHGEDREESR